jgi:hydroxyacylglutathione hydrolase
MMNPTPLPAFNDNDIWMFHDGRRAAMVGPVDAALVEAALDAQGLQLGAILMTHHWAGHVETQREWKYRPR